MQCKVGNALFVKEFILHLLKYVCIVIIKKHKLLHFLILDDLLKNKVVILETRQLYNYGNNRFYNRNKKVVVNMKDFVPYELAVKLKEKGYPQVEKNTLAMYDEDGCISYLCPTLDINRDYYIFDDFDEDDCVSPTISQVLKWLREEKRWVIVVRLYSTNGWYWFIQDEKGELKSSHLASCDDCFPTYELAALAGIEYVIDKLI